MNGAVAGTAPSIPTVSDVPQNTNPSLTGVKKSEPEEAGEVFSEFTPFLSKDKDAGQLQDLSQPKFWQYRRAVMDNLFLAESPRGIYQVPHRTAQKTENSLAELAAVPNLSTGPGFRTCSSHNALLGPAFELLLAFCCFSRLNPLEIGFSLKRSLFW